MVTSICIKCPNCGVDITLLSADSYFCIKCFYSSLYDKHTDTVSEAFIKNRKEVDKVKLKYAIKTVACKLSKRELNVKIDTLLDKIRREKAESALKMLKLCAKEYAVIVLKRG